MLQDAAFVNQGSSMQKGLSPIGGETFLWTAAMVVKEVILTCPDNLDPEEFAEYFKSLDEYLVIQDSTEVRRILTTMVS